MTRHALSSAAVTTLALVLLAPRGSVAAANPELKCRSERTKATGKFQGCVFKVLAKWYSGSTVDKSAAWGKCKVKYGAVWPKLQLLTGSSCDAPRWMDNGNGTVTDNLSSLQWEKKTDDGAIHDRDNKYTWTDAFSVDPTPADGTAYTSFVRALTAFPCFAGQCDWRLPTLAELFSIVLSYPCTTSPCIDAAFDVTPGVGGYWSTTPYVGDPFEAWSVGFSDGSAEGYEKDDSRYVRAVRGA